MADRKNQVAENVPGRYYVDEQCIHCGICVDTAPENFKFNDEDTHAFVYKQPDIGNEITNCQNSLESCPVSAIGND
jgi:ferredoxin